jgi:pimeloyl-ACP methyl ester carboxylesterase
MRKHLKLLSAVCLAGLVLLAGCYQPGGPVPEGAHPGVARDYTQEDVDRVVIMEEQAIASPLPAQWGAPPECDEIHFLRFRPSDGSTLDPADRSRANPQTTDAMLVMLPGVLEGANGFEYLARQLVYMAKTQDKKNFEVWAVERRNNRLEDLTGVNYLEEKLSRGEMDMDEAVAAFVGYYYQGKPLNGRTFHGWYDNQDLPFLSEFGLKLDTEDVFKVIQTLVPDPEVRRRKVFVGGHSMGGIMTSYFAGWDLDGDPATTGDAGYNNCAGMFALDTLVISASNIANGWAGFMRPDLLQMVQNMSEVIYTGILDGFKDGSYPVILNSGPVLSAEIMDLLEAVAMASYYAPDEENTYIRSIPWSEEVELVQRFIHSRDFDTFYTSTPRLQDFRYTNEALFGSLFDDSFVPIGMIQNSMGFLQGGPVVLKEFPQWPLGIIPGLDNSLGKGPYYIANDAGPVDDLGSGPLYSWVNFDEVGDASDPDYKDTTGQTTLTTVENEVADIKDVARTVFKGPFNLVEWYFSLRLLIDQMAAMMPYGKAYGLNFLHGDKLAAMPQVSFICEQGMMGDLDLSGIPGETHLIKGYNHLDILTACANASARRPNEVIRPLIDFVLRNV